jgi:uncharacterized protein
MPQLALGALAICIGALVQGTTGFGIALVAVPVLMLLMPPALVPPVMVLLSLVNNAVVLSRCWRAVRLRLVLPLIISGVLGLPLGAWILKALDPRGLKLAIGIGVVLMALAMLAGVKRRLKLERLGLAIVGFMGGVLHTSTSVSGPPVILFLANQGVEKEKFRANLIAYFTVLNLFSIGVYWAFGLLHGQVFTAGLAYLLPLVLGSLGGVWLARRIDERLFRQLVLALVVALGVALIISTACTL